MPEVLEPPIETLDENEQFKRELENREPIVFERDAPCEFCPGCPLCLP